jgi:acyl-CoA thioesterase FadM
VITIIEDIDSGKEVARGHSVLVAYDYRSGQSMVIPDEWRKVVQEFEELD